MRSIDRTVIAAIAIAGLLGAFWFLVLSPKREESAELQQRIEQLQASVEQQEGIVAMAEQARADFDANYQRLVILGKAVPEDGDTASLFVQLGEIADESKVEFDLIQLDSGGGAAEAPAPAAEETTTDQNQQAEEPADGEPTPEATETASSPPVPPVEAAVAGLPIGATVGPAGLPVMPYTIELRGTFFELADFLDGLDALVRPRGQHPRVQGRLITVDGFALNEDEDEGFPKLAATLAVNTFVTPDAEGLTVGATFAGPAPAVPTSTPETAP